MQKLGKVNAVSLLFFWIGFTRRKLVGEYSWFNIRLYRFRPVC
jgi:hypothetical protein